MKKLTRTVMCSLQLSTYLTLEGRQIVPECITRFGVGTRVEVRTTVDNSVFAVKPVEGDPLNVFGEERWTWHVPVTV